MKKLEEIKETISITDGNIGENIQLLYMKVMKIRVLKSIKGG